MNAEPAGLEAEDAAIRVAAQAEINRAVQANSPPHSAPQPGNQHQPGNSPPNDRGGGNQSAPKKGTPSPEKTAKVKKTVLDSDGKPFGTEDSKP